MVQHQQQMPSDGAAGDTEYPPSRPPSVITDAAVDPPRPISPSKMELGQLLMESDGTESAAHLKRLEKAREITIWFGTLAVASTILTVGNKAIMHEFNYANMVLLLQSLLSALILCGAALTGLIDVNPITSAQIRIFLMSSVLKVLQVVSSLMALPNVAIATVMVFRNLAIVTTAIIDYFFFDGKHSRNTVLALGLVVAGSLIYTGFDVNFHAEGYAWLVLNTVLYVLSVVYNKVYQTRLQEAKTQTAQGNALIEQSWMCLWGIGFAYFGGELTPKVATELFNMTPTLFWLFAATGVAAPIIGTAYAKCFAIASPTTVTVAATVNKCISIIIASFVFSVVHLKTQYFGLTICVLAGAWYGEEQKKAKNASTKDGK